MNRDDSAKDLSPGDYRDSRNLVAVSDGTTGGVRRENLQGTRKVPLPVGQDSVIIGASEYREGNQIYIFVSEDSPNKDGIYEYDANTETVTALMRNNLLNFDRQFPVHDSFVIEDLLYFNDGKNSTRKINIDFAKTGALDNITDKRLLSLIKAPPLVNIIVSRETDPTVIATRPTIRAIPIQFALRYVYLDDEVSVISPPSRLAPVMDFDEDTNEYNYIQVILSIDIPLIPVLKRVELLARNGNDNPWYIYDDFDPADFSVSTVTYKVYADRRGSTLSEVETGQLFDSVPRLSDSMAYMENRIFVPDSLAEFDPEFDQWDCQITISEDRIDVNDIRADVLLPDYYKDRSRYQWGAVFFDASGRQSGAITRDNMERETPTVFRTAGFSIERPYFLISGGVALDFARATPSCTGKPPSWAVKYTFVRSENLTWASWWQGKFNVKPLVQSERVEAPTTADPLPDGQYWENGYLYHDLQYWARTSFDTGLSSFNWDIGQNVDVVLPDGIPVSVDEKTVLKLAFKYPAKAGSLPRDEEFTIHRIESNRMRITSLNWLDWGNILTGGRQREYSGANIRFGGGPPVTEELQNDEVFLHFEVLNPKPQTDDILLFSTGKIYDIISPGQDSRAFQPTHDPIPGDCYIGSYQQVEQDERNDTDDTITQHRYSAEQPGRTDTLPIAGWLNTNLWIVYPSLAPFAYLDDSSFWDLGRENDMGFVTVAVEEQSEKMKGHQIRWSNTFVQDSFINGLSTFPEENKIALSADRGIVTKLVATNERVLLAVHIRSMTSLYINQRFIQEGEGGQFSARTTDVVGDQRKLLQSIGTTHPESVVMNNSRVYGFDSIVGEPWRRSQDGITPLASTFKMKTYFEAKAENIRFIQQTDPTARIQIFGGFDQLLDMYILTFAKIIYQDGANQIIVQPETIGFSEKIKGWVTFMDFDPQFYSSARNDLVSFKNNSLWVHHDSAARNTFYENTFSSKITVSANDNNDMDKIFKHIGVASNAKWKIDMITPDGQESELNLTNFVVRDSMFYADILRDKNTPAELLFPGQTAMLNGEKIIGQTMNITLTNSDNIKTVLDAIYVGYSPAAGHLIAATG